ncbi:MAG: helix-turn-helix transcriptional regulator [Alphaproteobacteria bacterium]|nr:helix-turn-helix transcriptional regulator [Alphaproteobacteria bacterium]MBU2271594.1 helix-turn-helix transcriptional regulator [Alphaproteobacteria bacterium]MBU2418985.1 helix-turn-helix transcriptional regulator [Alphaproteobacteria bacterium]
MIGLRFDTAVYRPEDRYEAWRCRGWPSLAPIMDSREPGRFWADITTYALGPAPLIHARDMTGLAYERDGRRARRDYIDHYGIMACVACSAAGEAAGRAFRGGPGDLIIGDFGLPHRQVSSNGEAISVSIPRAVAESVIPDLWRWHGMVIPAHQARAAFDCLCAPALQAGSIVDEAAPQQLLLFLQVLKQTLDAVSGVEKAAPPLDLAADWRARRLIESRFPDPAFSPAMVARAVGVSRSKLYRLFEGGDGLMEQIRDRRLKAAADMLVRAPGRSIEAVAQACGFREPRTLRRLFAARYGVSPADFRALALRCEPGRPTG